MSRRLVAPAAFVALALTLGACGGGGEPSGTGAAASSASSAGTSTIVPAVRVTEVATGEQVDLRSRVAADRPTLLWMWAPS